MTPTHTNPTKNRHRTDSYTQITIYVKTRREIIEIYSGETAKENMLNDRSLRKSCIILKTFQNVLTKFTKPIMLVITARVSGLF